MTETSSQSSITQTDDSSFSFDEYTTDELTTDELLYKIEYNTRMTSVGVSHIYITGLVLLAVAFLWIIIRKWYFGGV